MILGKRRALICASVFGLAAAVGGGARAAQIYPGCAQPGPIGKVWYVDPVNGKTAADGGNGSQAAPWNSLQGVVSSAPTPGYARPLLSSIPYFHRQPLPGTTQRVYPDETGAVVRPGDEILLMGGQYGDVSIGTYAVRTTNPAFVTIAAAPGQTPVLASLKLSATNMWRFQHLSVQSIGENVAITITDQASQSLTTADIIFESIVVGSPESVDSWTQAQWIANAHKIGVWELSTADGLNTKCVSFTGGAIYGVRFGAGLFAHESLFSNNTIDHFGDDGVDYGANDLIISDNYVHDNLDVGDANHEDCMQGFIGPLNRSTALKNPKGVPYTAYSNITIKGNRCIRQTDPNLKFPVYLQGIDAFDSDWSNLTVVNNVIVTTACWGIAYASVHGGKIINNTVLADGLLPAAGGCKPIVSVGDMSHQGLPSNDVIIRNNIANGLNIYNVNPNMTMDHNICLTIDGRCQIITYLNGKPIWGVSKPGVYGDHNIIGGRGAASEFVSFDPAKLVYDVRLRPQARAIGAGNPAEAPPVDIAGAPRGTPIDAGAYQYGPSK
jgi:hypothetical protein